MNVDGFALWWFGVLFASKKNSLALQDSVKKSMHAYCMELLYSLAWTNQAWTYLSVREPYIASALVNAHGKKEKYFLRFRSTKFSRVRAYLSSFYRVDLRASGQDVKTSNFSSAVALQRYLNINIKFAACFHTHPLLSYSWSLFFLCPLTTWKITCRVSNCEVRKFCSIRRYSIVFI